jgi:hypothetical protein
MSSQDASRQIFSPKMVAGLIVAGIVAFAAFVLLTAYADNFRSARDGRGHALSISADGFAGIVKLVDLVGGESIILRSAEDIDSGDLLVVALEARTDRKSLSELLAKRGARATLIILPKWNTMPDPTHPGWVRTLDSDAYAPALELLEDVRVIVDKKAKPAKAVAAPDFPRWIDLDVPQQPQTISGPKVTPLIVTQDQKVLLGRIGDGQRYVLADPDLMNNQGVANPRTAHAALQILAALNASDAEGVLFDVGLNGFGSKPSILKLPFEPPFLPLTLALLVAVLLAGLHGAFRFGPETEEERAIAFGKSALVENSAGLIQIARREHRTGGAYADLIRHQAAIASGAPPSLRGAALDSYLDRISQGEATNFSMLAKRAEQAGDRFALLAAAHALFQWKKDHIR